jgi:cytochrome P450 family 2 subfamily J
VHAFICETLRFRTLIPLVFHLTDSKATIDNYNIPKSTFIGINLHFMSNDPKCWENPDVFNPNRFLDSNSNFNKSKLSAFLPFSTGKRMCIGDKFAMNTLFLTLVSFLQATNGYEILLYDKLNTDLEPKNMGFFLEPKTYKIILNKQ